MQCDQVTAKLPEIIDSDAFDIAIENHVDSCLACQAEVARYRKLLRTMHQLRAKTLEPAPGAVAKTLNALAANGERRAIRATLKGRKLAYVGAIGGTAVAAGAATAVVFIARSRRLKLAG